MPYRESERVERCRACERIAHRRCARCRVPVCDSHLNDDVGLCPDCWFAYVEQVPREPETWVRVGRAAAVWIGLLYAMNVVGWGLLRDVLGALGLYLVPAALVLGDLVRARRARRRFLRALGTSGTPLAIDDP